MAQPKKASTEEQLAAEPMEDIDSGSGPFNYFTINSLRPFFIAILLYSCGVAEQILVVPYF